MIHSNKTLYESFSFTCIAYARNTASPSFMMNSKMLLKIFNSKFCLCAKDERATPKFQLHQYIEEGKIVNAITN